MARGQINPIQLYGDTLKIIGNFLNGIPKGVHDARLEKIAQQMQLVSQKKADIDRQMDSIGDLDRLNQHLQNNQLCISLAEDGSYLSIAEVDHGIISRIFYAEANGADWNVQSGINDSKKLEVLESFVEAEAEALAEPEPETKQVQESPVPVQDELCIT